MQIKPAVLYKPLSAPVGACEWVADHARKAMFCRGPQKCIAEKYIEAKLRLAGAPWKDAVLSLQGKRAVAGDQRCKLLYSLLHFCTRNTLWYHGVEGQVNLLRFSCKMLAPVLLLNIWMTGRSHAQRARDAKLKGSSSCKCAMFCIVDVGALPEIPVMFFGLVRRKNNSQWIGYMSTATHIEYILLIRKMSIQGRFGSRPQRFAIFKRVLAYNSCRLEQASVFRATAFPLVNGPNHKPLILQYYFS